MPDSVPSENIDTSEIRRLKRAQRRLLSPHTQQKHSTNLCMQIIKLRSFQNSQNIAFYLANDGEISPDMIIQRAWFQQKKAYLPILSPIKTSLYFAPYTANGKTTLNKFNIQEPNCSPSLWKRAAQLDLIFLPLVAFDLKGNRIGMGAGYYDRTLSYLTQRKHWKKPTLVGLAHEIQKVGTLNQQLWDIPLDYIVTEKKIYHT